MKKINVQFLPLIMILAVFVPIAILNSDILSYNGLRILFKLAPPIALATLAQMFAIVLGDIDFSLGNFISLSACVSVSVLPVNPLLASTMFMLFIVFYAGIGSLIYYKKMPSIVVTIGMSFIWFGIAIMIQPVPGGEAPQWLSKMINIKTPFIPYPLLISLLFGFICYLFLFKTKTGLIIRGIGGNAHAIYHAGWSLIRYRIIAYSLLAVLGIFSGITLAGITTSADANISSNYTILAVSGVIIGGGAFTGGKVHPMGAVLGALTMTLIGTLLSFLHISSNLQAGSRGILIILVLFINSRIQVKKYAI